MSNNAATELDNRIQGRARLGLVILFIIPVIIAIWEPLVNLNFSEVAAVNVVYTIVSAGMLFVAVLARFFQIHRLLDHITFRNLRAVSQEIQDQFVVEYTKTGLDSETLRKVVEGDHMELFYSFANNQDVLRGHAFYMWENYFSLLLFMFFSVLSGVITALTIWHTGAIFAVYWVLIIPIGITIASFLFIHLKTSQKLRRHARKQVRQARVSDEAEFKRKAVDQFR